MIHKNTVKTNTFVSPASDSSFVFQLQMDAPLHRVSWIVSGRYSTAKSTWALQPSIGDRWKQSWVCLEKSWVWGKVEAGWGFCACEAGKYILKHILVESTRQHPNITPAKWGWTKMIMWLPWAHWQSVRNICAPLPIHSFHKQSEKASVGLCSISTESREAVCIHMQGVYPIAHRDWPSAALQRCSEL